MGNIGNKGEQSTTTEISALTALTALATTPVGSFITKTDTATFANVSAASAIGTGSTTITTLGTITTGTWNGSILAVAYGGTGGSSPSIGLLNNITGLGISGTTGTGNLVFATSPTLTTASLGSSTATTQTQNDNSTKVATTAYVDLAILGQNYKEAAKYTTTGALPTVVYSSGAGTITGFAFGAISLDGNTPVVGDRLLIKNQASSFQNGIYTVTVVGTAGTVFVLTRATDANASVEFKTGDLIFVTAGTTLSSTTWAYTGIDSPNFTSDAISYVQVAGQGSFTAGTGISITGVSIAIDTSVTVDKTTAQTLTNKRITKRVLTLSAGSATPAINTDSYDVVRITAQSAAITSFTTNLTGTPVDGDTLRISITDDGTGRALTWGTSFEASTVALPTTTVLSARLDVGFFWNAATSKWRCVATA